VSHAEGRPTALLLLLLAAEVAVFSFTGDHFLSFANLGELIRLSVELGLLSLALTCVIVTGGIDLSVGSMMGLSAVAFGWLTLDRGLPPFLAALVTLALGAAGGALNALWIARLGKLPLIITLGTFSLFRGLAEGLTGGARNFTGFSEGFLFLGQGFWAKAIPAQTPVFLLAILGFWLLLERSVAGRALFAIGFSPSNARHSGLPVRARLALVYILSGITASLAAIVYVAHLGQAKADAGTGYELMAITAVVLGGTSIFGGRGSIGGTLLGLAAIVVLQNGLRLSGLPVELAGILTGALLVATIGFARRSRGMVVGVALLAVIAVGGHAMLSSRTSHKLTVAMMPKAKGDPYFVSCRQGAEEAAKLLGVDLLWDGPTELDPAKQNEVVEGWITRGVDVIAVSVDNVAGISTVLRKARARGIGVLTWDADAEPGARDFFIDQATPQGIGEAIADQVAEILHDDGSFAIVTASLTAANQNEWIRHIKARIAEKYPRVKLTGVRPSDGDRDRAFAETQTILKVNPEVRAIAAIAAPAVPGAAEAVRQSGRTDVFVTGLSLPNLCKPYLHAGSIRSIVLWNTRDLGYLTVTAAKALRDGTLKPGDTSLEGGRLGKMEVRGREVMLGKPFLFTKENVDRFDF
jgi:rhamnose transport system substrate-binding protein